MARLDGPVAEDSHCSAILRSYYFDWRRQTQRRAFVSKMLSRGNKRSGGEALFCDLSLCAVLLVERPGDSHCTTTTIGSILALPAGYKRDENATVLHTSIYLPIRPGLGDKGEDKQLSPQSYNPLRLGPRR